VFALLVCLKLLYYDIIISFDLSGGFYLWTYSFIYNNMIKLYYYIIWIRYIVILFLPCYAQWEVYTKPFFFFVIWYNYYFIKELEKMNNTFKPNSLYLDSITINNKFNEFLNWKVFIRFRRFTNNSLFLFYS